MQFQTPQFIEVEDKVFAGALSFRQFLYLAGAAGISYVLYASLPFFFAILLILPIASLGIALAFLKIHKRPFIDVLEAAFLYVTRAKLYIWSQEWKKKEAQKKAAVQEPAPLPETMHVPSLSQSKLKDIAWSLDVQKNVQ
ncbi:MAG: PrgI family protein [Parcubacteria group bacterium]|nr:PrgI family protein [Parcubacteria group bacterium]